MKKEGFNYAFDPKACEECQGNCCIGESGYIWVNEGTIQSIARALNLDLETFITNYLTKIRYRYTIKEIPYKDGFRCIFFDVEEKGVRYIIKDQVNAKLFHFGIILKTIYKRLKKSVQVYTNYNYFFLFCWM